MIPRMTVILGGRSGLQPAGEADFGRPVQGDDSAATERERSVESTRDNSSPVRLGDTANDGARAFGKPLDGVRVLAAEQMQALPYATQMLARLGADVVKVEHPEHGESGRASTPAMLDPQGRKVGATFLRNHFGKRSLRIDRKTLEGRELFLALVPRFDVIAENFKPGTMDRMGLGYDAIAAHHPGAIYLSI